MVLVDVHAEATSEKVALARWLDGRVTAVIGTHTHVQTSDARVQPGGTAAITDAGMTGPHDSVIGVKAELATQRMRTGMPVRFEVADGRRPDRGRADRVRPRNRPRHRDQAGSSPLAVDRAAPARRGQRRGRRARGHGRARATRRSGRTASRDPSRRRGTRGASARRHDEERHRGDAPRALDEHDDPSSHMRNCGDRPCRRRRTRRRQRRRSGRSARRSRSPRGRTAPRREREQRRRRSSSARRDGGAVPVRFCDRSSTPIRAASRKRGEGRAGRRSRGSRSGAGARAGARRSASRPRARGARREDRREGRDA